MHGTEDLQQLENTLLLDAISNAFLVYIYASANHPKVGQDPLASDASDTPGMVAMKARVTQTVCNHHRLLGDI